jgi:hypothetical protein
MRSELRTGSQRNILTRYLDTTGDGSGTKNAIGNYASSAQIFRIAPASGKVFRISRMLINIEDTAGMKAENYGDTGSPLTNGIEVRTHDGSSTLIDLTDGIPIKTNAHWGRTCYDVDIKSWSTAPTNELLLARWSFFRCGQYLRLNGSKNQELQVVLNDNLTGLISHYFMVQGFEEGPAT